tara:strand:- start:744 stop:1280 length:537 start_codon:yes stop_codon:yes gene_type:complete
MKDLEKKLQTHETIQWLTDIMVDEKRYGTPNPKLIGGAVVDIIEGREPNDFDFEGLSPKSIKELLANGFKFESDTRTATTYVYKDDLGFNIKVQDVKIPKHEFDYTISQATYGLKSKTLDIDEVSFNSKILIPTGYEFNQAMSALYRIPHWKRKGYTLPEITYASLLNSIKKVTFQKS